MKTTLTALLLLALAAPAALAQSQEEIENYLVAPYTLNKVVTVTMADGRKVEGTVIAGDDNNISVAHSGGVAVLPTGRIVTVRFRRPKRSAKSDLAGNLIGGIAFGIGGAALGRQAAQSIQGRDEQGPAGPIIGGVVMGLAGGIIGTQLFRQTHTEDVTLKVTPGVEGQAPKIGSLALPPLVSSPPDSARVQPVDPRR